MSEKELKNKRKIAAITNKNKQTKRILFVEKSISGMAVGRWGTACNICMIYLLNQHRSRYTAHLPSQHLYRFLSASFASVCTASTRIFAIVKNHMSFDCRGPYARWYGNTEILVS